MRIAICDDDTVEARKLYKQIFNYSQKQTIHIYNSADRFVNEYRNGARYDLVFMDIQMEGMSGVQAAEILQNEFAEEKPLVVFFTVTDAYLNSTHKYAWWYIRKPVTTEDLYALLESAWEKFAQPAMLFETDKGTCNLMLKDIIYIESCSGKSLIITVSDNYTVSMSLQAMIKILPDWLFFQTNRGYCVNLLHVVRYDKKEIILTNSWKAGLSKERKLEFVRTFNGFLKR